MVRTEALSENKIMVSDQDEGQEPGSICPICHYKHDLHDWHGMRELAIPEKEEKDDDGRREVVHITDTGGDNDMIVEREVQANTIDLQLDAASIAIEDENEVEEQGSLAIQKYTIPLQKTTELEMPESAWIMKVDSQCDEIVFWALVNPAEDAKKEKREFVVVGTGWDIEASFWRGLAYLGTVKNILTKKARSEDYVWHVFRLGSWRTHKSE